MLLVAPNALASTVQLKDRYTTYRASLCLKTVALVSEGEAYFQSDGAWPAVQGWRMSSCCHSSISLGELQGPVLLHKGNKMGDTWNIIQYLDAVFPNTPTLLLETPFIAFLHSWYAAIHSHGKPASRRFGFQANRRCSASPADQSNCMW